MEIDEAPILIRTFNVGAVLRHALIVSCSSGPHNEAKGNGHLRTLRAGGDHSEINQPLACDGETGADQAQPKTNTLHLDQ